MSRNDENPEAVAKFDAMIAEWRAGQPEPTTVDEVFDRLERERELWDEWFGPR